MKDREDEIQGEDIVGFGKYTDGTVLTVTDGSIGLMDTANQAPAAHTTLHGNGPSSIAARITSRFSGPLYAPSAVVLDGRVYTNQVGMASMEMSIWASAA